MRNEKRPSAANVAVARASVRASIEDGRSETREIFEGLSTEERAALAFKAWNAGLRAVSEAKLEEQSEEPRRPSRLSTLPPSRW